MVVNTDIGCQLNTVKTLKLQEKWFPIDELSLTSEKLPIFPYMEHMG